MRFFKGLMYLCAGLAFGSFFVMIIGSGEGDAANIVFIIGALSFGAFASAAQMLKNHIEWKEKQQEKESVKRYLKEKGRFLK